MGLSIPDKKILIALVCGVVLVYACAAILFFSATSRAGVPATFAVTPAGDALDYVSLAHVMLSEHRFALAPSAAPEFFRLPGYPLFLAFLFSLSSSPFIVPIAQTLLIAINCVLIYLLGLRYFSRGAGIFAALLYAFDPTTVMLTMTTLSETLYVFLILWSIYLAGSQKRTWQVILCAGLLLGASVLVRPVGIFLFPLFCAWTVFPWQGWKICMRNAAIMLVGALIVVVPWMTRNYFESGHFAVSSVSVYGLLFYNVVEFENFRTGVPKDVFIKSLETQLGTDDNSRLRSFEFESQETALDREYIGGRNLIPYAVFHLEKTAPFFIGSSIETTTLELHNLGLPVSAPAPTNISSLVMHGQFTQALGALSQNPFGLLERLFWALATLSAVLYTCATVWKRMPVAPYALIALLTILAFAVVTGPISEPRYRVPTEPLLFLLAFTGIQTFVLYLKRRSALLN